MTAGSHHPLACQLEDNHGRGGWVVKPQHTVAIAESRTALTVLAELAGAEVCSWVGLPTPAVGVLVMPPKIEADLLPSEHRDELRQLFSINAGSVAFCSRLLDPVADVNPAVVQELAARRPDFLTACATLYALDAFIHHDDRTEDRPNALLWRDQLVAIDHGNAFVGLNRRGHNGATVAAMTYRPPPLYRRHVARAPLLNNLATVSLAAFVGGIQQVLEQHIDKVAARWPDELDVPSPGFERGLRTEMVCFLKGRRKLIEEIVTNVLTSLRESDAY